MYLAFVALFAALFILLLIIGGFSLAPWVPTKKRDIKRINILAKLQKNETLYELGCGDGRVCHALAELNPKANIIGIELSPLLFLLAKLRSIVVPCPNLKLLRANIFHSDFSDADVIYVFGRPDTLERMQAHIRKHQTKSIRIISYSFPPDASVEFRKSKRDASDVSLYSYSI